MLRRWSLCYVAVLFLISHSFSQLSGYYDVGGGNNDFPSPIAAAEALVAQGISGRVTFNVYSGTYNGQVYLPPISGCSSANAITFQAAPGESPIITNLTGSGETENGFYIKGADYITIQGFEITNVHGKGIYVNKFSYNDKATHNKLINNYIHNIGFALHSYGIYLFYAEDCQIIANEIQGDYWGIDVYGGGNNLIYNNMVYGSQYYDIYDLAGDQGPNMYLYNSIYTTAPFAMSMNTTASSDRTVFKNNNIFNNRIGGFAFSFSSWSPTPISDYNNLYAPYGWVGRYGDSLITLTQWQNATGLDLNSISADPSFVSTTNLHIDTIGFSPVNGAGVAISEVSNDFDGEPRDSTNPDIGADEFSLYIFQYCVNLEPEQQGETIGTGEHFDYAIGITNCGSLNDAYDLTVTAVGNPWIYEILNYTSTSVINEISVESGLVDSFIVRAYIPAGAASGDISSCEIIAQSQHAPRNVYSDTAWTTTTAVETIIPPYFENFNTSPNDFLSIGTSCWEWGEPTVNPSGAHSPPNCWGTVIDGTYPTYACCLLQSPPIRLIGHPTLKFYQWYEIEHRNDGGNLKISTNRGLTWNLITPVGGYPDVIGNVNNECLRFDSCYAMNSGGWIAPTFDLSDYSPGVVYLQWEFGSDGATQQNGWFIDDISISGPHDYCIDLMPPSVEREALFGDSLDYTTLIENCGVNDDTYDLSLNVLSEPWRTEIWNINLTSQIDSIQVPSFSVDSFTVRVVIPEIPNSPLTSIAEIIAESRNGTPGNVLMDRSFITTNAIPLPEYLIFHEYFDHGSSSPPGWTIIDGGTCTGLPGRWHPELRTGNDYFMIADSYNEYWECTQFEQLISPVIDCSGIGAVYLQYWHSFRGWSTYDFSTVDLSINFSSWLAIASYNRSNTLATVIHHITPWAGNQSNVRIRFLYIAECDYWWKVDSVRVYQIPPAPPIVEDLDIIMSGSSTAMNHVTLQWSPSSGAAQYHIYKSTQPDAGFNLIGSAPGTTFTDSSAVDNAIKNFYYITADNSPPTP